ncbi:MAG: hypothetical protein JRE23_02915 [Deltaproteobacteria bacterium]|nr:hypothetical protein [Deltaproteobacteria bacterium]
MKRALLLCLLAALVFSTTVVYAESIFITEGNFVTSKELSLSDVEGAVIKKLKKDILVHIYGIHQKGNEATVYYQYKRGLRSRTLLDGRMTFVRFNSGKWFNPGTGEFLRK